MGSCATQPWFEAAQANDAKFMKGAKLMGSVDEREESPFRGFSAIHYAAYFGCRDVMDLASPHELDLVTKYPVKLQVFKRNKAVAIFPAGLSFQGILAISGRYEILKQSVIRHGVIKAPVPLASCLVVGVGFKFARQFQDIVLQDLFVRSQNPFSNPLTLSIVIGFGEFTDLLLRGAKSLNYGRTNWMVQDCGSHFFQIGQLDAYHALKKLRLSIKEIDEARTMVQKAMSGLGFHADDTMGGTPRHSLSIKDYVRPALFSD
ncbi:hypothetical protein SS50377_28037 [Spironucleus salmonicida]|uniref:Ankyrin repeat-containing protein n=1 Tax=Spironucleus salmonicida TaxID=348837 RepID=V6LFV9_9EUKA|nr:hypothetical protein SS50377_28037 [Spironucleus salmonicida]|eukprot:EST42591.1 Hypothetical protein SS50377_17910 [Spironucleus salmonicida]